MEQYIYIFTIILEIFVFVQISFAILKCDKKISQINSQLVEVNAQIKPLIQTTREFIRKFNRIAAIIIKVKQMHIKKYILFVADIISLFFLLRSYKAYKGFKKLNFLRKIFSYSIIRAAFSTLKNFV